MGKHSKRYYSDSSSDSESESSSDSDRSPSPPRKKSRKHRERSPSPKKSSKKEPKVKSDKPKEPKVKKPKTPNVGPNGEQLIWCKRCKEKRVVKNLQTMTTDKGQKRIYGACSTCDAKLNSFAKKQ
jgi:hypothetical protein